MSHWTIDEPTTLGFDGVVALKATLVAGNISVLAGDKPSVSVGAVSGRPLLVTHEAGMLTITHEVWDGLVGWLRNERPDVAVTVTVPPDCPVHLNLVSANAVLSGLSASTSIKTGSGDVILDGVTGRIDVSTASGAIEAQGLHGSLTFNSVSGDLALARGTVDRLAAKTVVGKITADVTLSENGQVQINTVSGEVALRLPASTSAEVNLGSATARVDAAFPGLDRYERTMAKGFSGRLGTGSGRLTVSTISGSVTLLSRPEDPALED